MEPYFRRFLNPLRTHQQDDPAHPTAPPVCPVHVAERCSGGKDPLRSARPCTLCAVLPMIEIATGRSAGMSFWIRYVPPKKQPAHLHRIADTPVPLHCSTLSQVHQQCDLSPPTNRDLAASGQRNDNYSSVTFSAEAIRRGKILDPDHAARSTGCVPNSGAKITVGRYRWTLSLIAR